MAPHWKNQISSLKLSNPQKFEILIYQGTKNSYIVDKIDDALGNKHELFS